MDTIAVFFKNQGDTIKLYVDAFLSNPISDVLNYAFEIEKIEDYLESRKVIIVDKILELFKNHKKYVFAETDDDFVLGNDFFEFVLDFDGDLLKFKRHLKKASVKQLRTYEIKLFEENLFLEKER